jgi:hypothetical protein
VGRVNGVALSAAVLLLRFFPKSTLRANPVARRRIQEMQSHECAIMKKTKPKSKTISRGSVKRVKKAVDLAEVRQSIANMVGADAKKITKAVVDEALKGQLATVKYLFEMAGVYPASAVADPAMPEQDALARTLLHRMGLPAAPLVLPEDEIPLVVNCSTSGLMVTEEGSAVRGTCASKASSILL